MIDTILQKYFDLFSSDFFVLILSLGICFIVVYTIYEILK